MKRVCVALVLAAAAGNALAQAEPLVAVRVVGARMDCRQEEERGLDYCDVDITFEAFNAARRAVSGTVTCSVVVRYLVTLRGGRVIERRAVQTGTFEADLDRTETQTSTVSVEVTLTHTVGVARRATVEDAHCFFR